MYVSTVNGTSFTCKRWRYHVMVTIEKVTQNSRSSTLNNQTIEIVVLISRSFLPFVGLSR